MGKALIRTSVSPAPLWVEMAQARHLAAEPGGLQAPIQGCVFGVVLNSKAEREQLKGDFNEAPYKAPPAAPVLYIKPPNTYAPHGGRVIVPAGVDALEVNATLAVVMGRTATRVSAAQALDHVLGYTVALDVCLPHASLYRPAIRHRCQDGFLPIGPWIIDKADVQGRNVFTVAVSVNGQEMSRFSTDDLVRPIDQLIADVTDFMTLSEGDVLLVGLPANGPRAKAGDRVSAEIDGVGRLDCTLIAEEASL